MRFFSRFFYLPVAQKEKMSGKCASINVATSRAHQEVGSEGSGW